jgi:hypothetical protein
LTFLNKLADFLLNGYALELRTGTAGYHMSDSMLPFLLMRISTMALL